MKRLLYACLFFLMTLPVSASKYNIEETSWEQHFLRDHDGSKTFSGNGTREDPYLIANATDLACLAYWVNVRHEHFLYRYFKLTDDINISSYNWVPIGVDEAHPFDGYFDGNNKVVQGMSIEVESSTKTDYYYYGLFGVCRGAIRNLSMTNSYIQFNQGTNNRTRWICAGLLCGMLGNDHRNSLYGGIYGCSTQGSINGTLKNTDDRSTLGGIVGYAQNPVSIFRCHSDFSAAIEDAHDVGGIVGRIANYQKHHIDYINPYWGVVETSVYDCTARVELNMSERQLDCYHGAGICGTNNGGNIVACGSQGSVFTQTNGTSTGICGRNRGNVIGCVSTVSVSGGWNAGGIVGKNETLNFEGKTMKGYVAYCGYSGHIDGSTAQHTGGIVARSYYQGEANCFFLGTMQRSTVTKNSHPISQDGTGKVKENYSCYFDQNMVKATSDQGGTAKAIGTLTSGSQDGFSFTAAYLNTLECLVRGKDPETITGFQWQFEQGCYPRLVVSKDNYATLEKDEKEYVWNGMKFTQRIWKDDTDMKTPAYFPSYAAMVATPPNFINTHRAYDLDNAFSLADRNVGGITVHYSLPEGQKVLNIQNGTALMDSPGVLMLTASSAAPQITKQLRLDITYGQQWDGNYADSYDGGNGSPANPYLIHNAQQFAKMLRDNDTDEHYRLTQDVIFNKDLINTDGLPRSDAQKMLWNILGNNPNHLKASLDGNGHVVRGLYMLGNGIFNMINSGVVLENIGFVDTFVETLTTSDQHKSTSGFLASSLYGNAVVRNCIFEGRAKYFYNSSSASDAFGFVGQLISTNTQQPVIEDCVIAINGAKNLLNSGIYHWASNEYGSEIYTPVAGVRRCLWTGGGFVEGMTNRSVTLSSCYFPQGYFSHKDTPAINNSEKTVEELTNDQVFGDAERWQYEPGYFPTLKTFAKTDFGRLLSLPFYTTGDNRLDGMKRQMELRYGATVACSDEALLDMDADGCAIAPLKTGSAFLSRTLGKARMLTPIKVTDGFTAGVSFDDEHAQTLCLQNFNNDGNAYLSLSELRNVNDNQLLNAVTTSQTEAEQIARFNEFALFKGITQLGTTPAAAGAPRRAAAGTAFQHMKNLKEFRIPESVTAIGEEAFKGCDQLEKVTLPSTVMNVSGKAFYGSVVKNILVDHANANFTSRNGLLFNKDNDLVCYPNGLKSSSVTLSGNVRNILPNAFYKVEGLDSIFIDSPDLTSVVTLAKDGIIHHNGSQQMQVFINDGSFDGQLLQLYKDDASWVALADNDCLKRYYPLEIGEAKAATLYLGFDTQLPEALRVYLVNKEYTNDNSAMLLNISKKINNKLGAGTSVVVRADKPGTYRLYPYAGTDATKIPLYLNALNGVGEKGLTVNQGDANEGNCLTLGRNDQGKLGFFYYRKSFVKPFHAYMTVNTINARVALFDDDSDLPTQENDADIFDDEFAYKKSDDGKSCRAVWYYGDAQNITIPAEVEGIPVTALGKNLFYDSDLPVWSVNVPSSIKTLRVARNEKDNPFFGLNDSTIVYLPSADAGYTMPDDEWNVVMGDQCKRLYLVDRYSFIPPRDFYADYVQYTNQLWANPDIIWNYESGDMEEMETNSKDGTNEALSREADFDLFDIQYSRKAYAVCLPFDVDLKAMATNDDSALKAYQLKYVKDNLHFIFMEVSQQLKAGEPYFIVVNGGGYILLNDTKTKISAQLHPLDVTDFTTGAVVGQFRGTFSFLSNDEAIAEHAYIIQASGNWHRIANQTELQRQARVWPFRTYFSRTDGFVRNRYFTNYKSGDANARQRVAEDGIIDFPADAYDSDYNFDVEDDPTAIRPVIHAIDLDGTERIYDLSGRQLNSKPGKGAYIKNGKKYINK